MLLDGAAHRHSNVGFVRGDGGRDDRDIGHCESEDVGHGLDAERADGGPTGSEESWRKVADDLIDNSCTKESSSDDRSALEKDVAPFEAMQFCQHLCGISGLQVEGVGRVVEDPVARAEGSLTDDDTQRLMRDGVTIRIAHGELRVIHNHGVRPNHDDIAFASQAMSI